MDFSADGTARVKAGWQRATPPDGPAHERSGDRGPGLRLPLRVAPGSPPRTSARPERCPRGLGSPRRSRSGSRRCGAEIPSTGTSWSGRRTRRSGSRSPVLPPRPGHDPAVPVGRVPDRRHAGRLRAGRRARAHGPRRLRTDRRGPAAGAGRAPPWARVPPGWSARTW